ncbi:leucyl/phenylalanyl-tRNA--protein transferase [Candidatus Puniceispirillum marinum]|uniref:Leucyl/phenylalanyl-tRNA--protein transferase n=1 Tax=Puniceispirillum marinum (strain IMCC1322) TaxID=488538 RepID=D5BSN7_PUNMI|nr:leucyl/phenylalanyl-tRNA--protein transferase [Candidatus Puniceispirillum marinum]ADE39284.1 leucyl/phenylalanyl-tRNA--protein transferase [Candidatus Puniceispirillum marinum IMCC1322]
MSQTYAFAPETLIKAYALGVFPMADAHDSDDIRFYDPEVRALIPLDDAVGTGIHIPRRLRRTVRNTPFNVTIDHDFPAIIKGCAELADDRTDTWINKDIQALYIALHKMGFAHSIEVWDGDRLVGGLYGVALRAAFFGESMFSRATDASKIALVHLMARLKAGGFQLLDAQFTNPHLVQFGITEISRDTFQDKLAQAMASSADLRLGTASDELTIGFLDTLSKPVDS